MFAVAVLAPLALMSLGDVAAADNGSVPPVAHVDYPNGGEEFVSGSTITVAWTATDDVEVVSVDVLLVRGKRVTTLVGDLPGSTVEWPWSIPVTTTAPTARIRVVAHDADGLTGQDASDAAFTVVSAPPPPADYSIGYIGCSNTYMTVAGYQVLVGADPLIGSKFWPQLQYGGGTIERWANPASEYWHVFDAAMTKYGEPDLIWLQLCAKDSTTEHIYEHAEDVEVLIRQRTAVPIYISGINGYVPGYNDGVSWVEAAEAASLMVAEGYCLQGPAMSLLGPGLTKSDHTHPNMAGSKLLGADLLAFFGPPDPPAPPGSA